MTTEYTMSRIGNEDTFLKLDEATRKYVRLKSLDNYISEVKDWKMGKNAIDEYTLGTSLPSERI